MPLDAADATGEITAMNAAYQVLAELDPQARLRGFTWLAGALGHPDIVMSPTAGVAATAPPVPAEAR